MLELLKVHGFRTLVNTEIRFDPLTIMIGKNGVGKTTILDSLQLLGNFSRGGIDRAFGPPPWSLSWQRTKGIGFIPAVRFEVQVKTEDRYNYVLSLSEKAGTPQVTEERLMRPDDNRTVASLGPGNQPLSGTILNPERHAGEPAIEQVSGVLKSVVSYEPALNPALIEQPNDPEHDYISREGFGIAGVNPGTHEGLRSRVLLPPGSTPSTVPPGDGEYRGLVVGRQGRVGAPRQGTGVPVSCGAPLLGGSAAHGSAVRSCLAILRIVPDGAWSDDRHRGDRSRIQPCALRCDPESGIRSVKASLVGFGQHAGDESRGKAVSACRKLLEDGAHGGKRSLGLGCDKDPRHPHDRDAALTRDTSTFRVVNEEKPGRLLLGERDRFCLAWIQNPRQLCDQFRLGWRLHQDSVRSQRSSERGRAWMSGLDGELSPNCGWDHDARVETCQKIESLDACQRNERAGVGDDHRYSAALISSFSSSGG